MVDRLQKLAIHEKIIYLMQVRPAASDYTDEALRRCGGPYNPCGKQEYQFR